MSSKYEIKKSSMLESRCDIHESEGNKVYENLV